jgi:hypothetical protein
MVRRRELPCVRRLRSLYRERVVGGVVSMSMERKKVIKKQRRSKKWLEGESDYFSHNRSSKVGRAA